jgi:type I restriction enzyme R subunit
MSLGLPAWDTFGMGLSESDTRAKLIDPALHACGWTEDLIKREETAGVFNIVSGKRERGRVDYTLRALGKPAEVLRETKERLFAA